MPHSPARHLPAAAAAFNARYPGPQDPGVIETAPNWATTLLDPSNVRQWAAGSGAAQPNNSYFSIDVGPAHIISLSNYVSQ